MTNNDFIPQPGMDVFGSDGEKVGSIDSVEQNHFVVRKGFFFPEDHFIPFTAVNTYDDGAVYLNVTRDGALEQQWGEQPLSDVQGSAAGSADATFVETTGDDPLIGTTDTVYGETAATDPTFGETGVADETYADTTAGEFRQDDAGTLEVREEDLHATAREVDRGSVRVEKHVVEEQQSIDVPLREEEVHVERRAVDRPAGSADFEESTIDVPVRGEEVDVSKTARVVEEVDIDKTARERVETVSDTVRREEVEIDTENVHGGVNRDRHDDDRSLMDKAKDAIDPDDDGAR